VPSESRVDLANVAYIDLSDDGNDDSSLINLDEAFLRKTGETPPRPRTT